MTLPAWTVILLLVLANSLLGAGLLRFLGKGLFAAARPARGLAAFSLGTGVVGWVALLLVEIGYFSVPLLAGVWLLLTLAAFLWPLPPAGTAAGPPVKTATQPIPWLAGLPRWLEWTALVLWLVAACWLFFRPHEFVTGAADAGVYVNLGAEIAQNGRLLIQDDFLASLDPALLPTVLRPVDNPVAPTYLFPGFYVIGTPAGEMTPQFFPLHPVWQAVAFGLAGDVTGGVQAALMMTGLWSLFGTAAVYLTVRQIAGWPTALLALAGLTVSGLQVWFARYPVTEALTQYLLWTALWALGAWLGNRRPARVWALLAGLMLGQLFLTRIDMLFIVPLLALLGVWIWLARERPSATGYFFTPLILLLVHALVHALWQSRPYFYDLFFFGLRLARQNWLLTLLAVLTGLGALLLLARYRGRFGRLAQAQRPLLLTLTGGWLVFTGYLWFVRPNLPVPEAWLDPYSGGAIPFVHHENLLRLGWYMSPLGVWLGAAGVALMVWRVRRQTVLLLAVTLLFSLLYLWNLRANPHQIYAMRRLVPATLPLFIVGATLLLDWLLRQRPLFLRGAALVVAVVWLGGVAWGARGLIGQVDYSGLTVQLNALDAQLDAQAVLLFNDQSLIGQGDILGTPLRFIHGHDVLSVRVADAAVAPVLDAAIGKWLADGRSVYWIDTPGGQTTWQPGEALIQQSSYRLEVQRLENTYTHRPTAIETLLWQGDVYQILPPMGAAP